MTGFRLARVVPDGPEAVRMDNPVRRTRVLGYLRAGAPVELDGVAGHRTDGRWIWPEAVAEQLERHDIAPEPEFFERITRYGFRCPPVTGRMVEAAVAALRAWST